MGSGRNYPMAGTNSCNNSRILTALAKQTLGLQGYIISDEGAVGDPHSPDSFRSGLDTYLGAGPSEIDFNNFLHRGQITMERVNDAAVRTLRARMLLGEFDLDDDSSNPFWDKEHGCEVIGAPAHRQVAYEAAVQSLVLLRNDGVLPLPAGTRVAVIGPMTNATWMYARYAYHPRPGNPMLVSVEEALAQRMGSGQVVSTPGCIDAVLSLVVL